MEHTERTKRRLSRMRTGARNPFYGKIHSKSSKRKMGNILRTYKTNGTFDINPVTINLPIEPDIAYIAGIVDGEGSIGFHNGRAPTIAVYNTSLELMRWLISKIGGTYSCGDKRGRTIQYVWHVQSTKNVYWLTQAMTPYLIVKLEKAKLVIKNLEGRYGDRLKV